MVTPLALLALEREVIALKARVARLEHTFGVRPGASLRVLHGGRP